MLIEPPRTNYDLNFTLGGVPVRIHPLFWLVSLVLAIRPGVEAAQVLIWVGVTFVSILIHEYGHALAFRYFGWEPRITLYQLGGLASAEMLYSNERPEGRTQILISLAGPVAGFLLALVTVAMLYATGHWIDFFGWEIGRGTPLSNPKTDYLVFALLYVNVFWGLVNLLPVYPLDGGQIAREVFLKLNSSDGIVRSMQVSIATAVAAAVGSLLLFGFKEGLFPAILFGMLAYLNHVLLRNYREGGFGGYGSRDW